MVIAIINTFSTLYNICQTLCVEECYVHFQLGILLPLLQFYNTYAGLYPKAGFHRSINKDLNLPAIFGEPPTALG